MSLSNTLRSMNLSNKFHHMMNIQMFSDRTTLDGATEEAARNPLLK